MYYLNVFKQNLRSHKVHFYHVLNPCTKYFVKYPPPHLLKQVCFLPCLRTPLCPNTQTVVPTDKWLPFVLGSVFMLPDIGVWIIYHGGQHKNMRDTYSWGNIYDCDMLPHIDQFPGICEWLSSSPNTPLDSGQVCIVYIMWCVKCGIEQSIRM